MSYFDITFGWRHGGEHRYQLEEATTNELLRDWRQLTMTPERKDARMRSYPTRQGRAIIDLAALVIVHVSNSEVPAPDRSEA